MQALSDLLLNCFKWHLLSNEAASLTVLSGIYRQMRQWYACYITVLSAVWTEEYLECSSGQLLKRYLESLRSVMRARSSDLRDQRIRRPWTCGNSRHVGWIWNSSGSQDQNLIMWKSLHVSRIWERREEEKKTVWGSLNKWKSFCTIETVTSSILCAFNLLMHWLHLSLCSLLLQTHSS